MRQAEKLMTFASLFMEPIIKHTICKGRKREKREEKVGRGRKSAIVGSLKFPEKKKETERDSHYKPHLTDCKMRSDQREKELKGNEYI